MKTRTPLTRPSAALQFCEKHVGEQKVSYRGEKHCRSCIFDSLDLDSKKGVRAWPLLVDTFMNRKSRRSA